MTARQDLKAIQLLYIYTVFFLLGDPVMRDPLEALQREIKAALPALIDRHRATSQLTWRMLHLLDAEVIAALTANGKHHPHILRMVRTSPVFQYPTDDRVADFGSSNAMPLTFAAIIDAWGLVH